MMTTTTFLLISYFFQVFCGKIPRDVYEDELIPLFEKCGTIWDLRLMMDPLTNLNRGYAFVTFTTTEAAQEAVNQVIFTTIFGFVFSV
jgi:RNA recognition motif-containing protein